MGAVRASYLWVIGSIIVACGWIGTPARAHAAPSALVIAEKAKPGSPEAEIIDAVRASLAELDEVRLLPPSPLDLEAAQLAIDCTDASARCLGELATRMEAQIVIIPSLKRRADALELQIKCFQQGASGEPPMAMRKQAGTQLDAALVDAVPSMLREVLQLESADDAAEEPSEPAPIAPPDERALQRSEREDGFIEGLPLGPVLLGGGGVGLVIAGVVVGAIASATEDEYASAVIDTEEQAQDADQLRASGKNQALTANILLGLGAGAIIGAGVWYLIDASLETEPTHARVTPVLGPSSAGLVLSGRWKSQL